MNNSIITSDPKNRVKLDFLNGLRGLAALYVMIGHARWLLWEGFAAGFMLHPTDYPPLSKIMAYVMLAFDYGHQAVIFFFVLSGFVIHLRYAQSLKQTPKEATFDTLNFFFRRFRRIYPLFMFALILTFGVDLLGMSRGYLIYSQQTAYSLVNLNVSSDHSLLAGLGNGLLCPTAATWGTNGPLWSLRIEWWFYVIYPLLWLAIRRSIRMASVLVIGLFLLTFINGLWPVESVRVVFAAFPAWFLGVLLADIYAGRLDYRFWKIGLLCCLFPVLPLLLAPFKIVTLPDSLTDFLWAFAFAGLIAACLSWQKRGGTLPILAKLKPLGDMSYSLYVLHFPPLVLISGWLMARSNHGLLPEDFTWVFIGCLACLALAYTIYNVFEKPVLHWQPNFIGRAIATQLVTEKP